MNNPEKGIRRQLAGMVIGVCLLMAFLVAYAAQPHADAIRCEEMSGVRNSRLNAGAYCPRGWEYCAGFIRFCCATGEAIGVCVGAWSECRRNVLVPRHLEFP